MATLKELQHEYNRTRGLWCIDRNPSEVDYDWIKKNAFQLTDYLKENVAEASDRINIGAFTLEQGTRREKVWMTDSSGQRAELDKKVLEDLLKSFF